MSAGERSGHVLVVDDERPIRRLLRLYLSDAGFAVTEASEGAEALAQVRRGGIDLVLLDLMLPDMDGVEVCRRLRDTTNLPVIMVTARGDEEQRLDGLEAGADDYVTKPFSAPEVVARVRAVLRRVKAPAETPSSLHAGPVTIELASRRAERDGTEVPLTRLEFDLLAELAARPGMVFTRERLLEDVWGYQSSVGAKTVDVHVANLRRKLGDDIGITAVRGVGYRLDHHGEA
jgi:DNA-binding response OmpR family regulator